MMDFGAIIIAGGIVRRVRAIGDIGIGDTDIGGINTFCEVLMKNNKPINKNMAKRWRRAAYVVAFVALWLPEDGLANSYIEMITTAPEGYVSETNNAYAAGGYGAPAVIWSAKTSGVFPAFFAVCIFWRARSGTFAILR